MRLFFNRHAYLLMLVSVSTFMPLCLRAVSTLAASCAPPSNPLSPSCNPLSVHGARGTHVRCRGPCFGYKSKEAGQGSSCPSPFMPSLLFQPLISIYHGLIWTYASLCVSSTLFSLCPNLHSFLWPLLAECTEPRADLSLIL